MKITLVKVRIDFIENRCLSIRSARAKVSAKWEYFPCANLYRDPYCNGFAWMTLWFLIVFRVCRALETFPDTLHTHQHQIIHFQHKIKIKIFSTWFWYDFELDLHSKKWWFLQYKACLLLHAIKKEDVYCKNHHIFVYKSSSKSYETQVENIFNFYFMFEMYNLMLVSVERVCDRFWGPTDSKNCQNRMVIQANPLQ